MTTRRSSPSGGAGNTKIGKVAPIYDHDGITLYHGDCLDILPMVGAVDHLVSDPPYSEASHALHDSGKKWASDQDGLTRKVVGFAHIDGESLMSLFRVADVARWAVFTMDESLSAFLRLHTPNGWRYVRTGLWIKPGSMPQFTGDRPAMGYEPICIMHRTGGRIRWNGGGKAGIWKHPPVHAEHPTAKPLGLYRQFIADFTDPGDLILDPFAGSGTTLRAAKDLGRRAIGIEIDAGYCKMAIARMRQTVLL